MNKNKKMLKKVIAFELYKVFFLTLWNKQLFVPRKEKEKIQSVLT